MEQGGTQGDGRPDLSVSGLSRLVLEYVVALGLVAVALGASLGLRPFLNATPDAPFFAAVAIASWFGGLGPGLVATFASALAVDYFLIPPLHAVNFDADHIIRLATFSVVSLLISWMSHTLQRERARAERREADAHRELAERRRIGSVNHRHLSFMGSITAPGRLVRDTAPAAARSLVDDGVDVALLVPV